MYLYHIHTISNSKALPSKHSIPNHFMYIQQLVAKGIVERSTMEQHIDLDESKLDAELDYSIQSAINAGASLHSTTPHHINADEEKKYNYPYNNVPQQNGGPVHANGGGHGNGNGNGNETGNDVNSIMGTQQTQHQRQASIAQNNMNRNSEIIHDHDLPQQQDAYGATNEAMPLYGTSNPIQPMHQQQQTWEISILDIII